jgi:hypothetical protein
VVSIWINLKLLHCDIIIKILWSNTNFPEHQDVLAADEEVGEKGEGDGNHIEVSPPHRLIRLCKPRKRWPSPVSRMTAERFPLYTGSSDSVNLGRDGHRQLVE